MKRLSLVIGCIGILLAGGAASLLSQSDSLERRRLMLSPSTEPTQQVLLAMRSPRITRALQSPDSLLAFVTRAEPFYLERRAAAIQSKGLIPVEWVPRLWRLMGELSRELRVHAWGLKPHPMSSIAYSPLLRTGSQLSRTRTVFGHEWTLPEKAIDYPLTPDEREQAPWPWQVEQALRDVYAGLIPSTYAPLDRPKAGAYLTAVLTMPCSNDDEAQLFVSAAQYSSHFSTPAVMGALRNIALNPGFQGASIQATSTYEELARLWNDTLAWGIGSVGLRDFLRDAPRSNTRDNAAYALRQLRESFRSGGTVRMPLPAAAVLEASRRALDPATSDAWTRLYVYAFSVVEALDTQPFTPNRGMDPKSPVVARRLSDFGRWFAVEQPVLVRLAEEQAPVLEVAARVLSTSQCR